FDFLADKAGVTLFVSANVDVGVLGHFDVTGGLRFMTGGVAGTLAVATAVDLGSLIPHVDAGSSAHLQVEINTTDKDQQVGGFAVSAATGTVSPGQTISVKSGFHVDAGGELKLGGLDVK